jgi:DNA-directed RNA polymerase subunit RPC12/RpoP
MQDNKNYFEELYAIDVNDKTEKKGNLTYLSWAWAWAEVKKKHPDANYTVYENAQGWNYHTDGRTAWVKVGVVVNGVEHIEHLPVMDFKNKSIPLNAITSFEVNKAIQRALTKACARHGLGLYIYAGEDLPEDDKTPAQTLADKASRSGVGEQVKEYKCSDCGTPFKEFTDKNGKVWNAGQVFHLSENNNIDGKARCSACANKAGTLKKGK